MLHVCDWLPTLISAAGGKHLLSNATSLDGVDAWEMLSHDGEGVRSEMLHNIDPVDMNAALRVGDYKLLVGDISLDRGGWYPPYQLSGDEKRLHYLNFTDNVSLNEASEIQEYRQHLAEAYRAKWPESVKERLVKLYSFAKNAEFYTGPYAQLDQGLYQDTLTSKSKQSYSDLKFEPERSMGPQGRILGHSVLSPLGGTPVTVDCGPKPENATKNCRPMEYPCLYHIPSDPCEYNNIAQNNTEIVSLLGKNTF
ncbi:arylsulfatase J-like [Elysia marginata]|uniref:Arylsulfatase J-like n=1 Tax=Elysia marginata TaxID=1093978 RepID=A0AAV4H420_9GAST|nr:arylsulfatase J-like [Elysia marginata]